MTPSFILENQAISEYTTLRIGGVAKYFTRISHSNDLIKAITWAKEKSIPIFPLGGGSNIIFSKPVYPGLIIKIEIPGFTILKTEEDLVYIAIGAGENWDATVKKTVDLGLSGIEAMSLIPGTTGATPVQNVGAYGQEIKDTLESVEVYDLKEEHIKTLFNSDCKFRYRNSIFKSEEKGRYIILGIVLKLRKNTSIIPAYPSLIDYLSQKEITNPTVMDIRNAVIDVRNSKLPDPKMIPNVGSFFENPIISKEQYEKLQQKYPEITGFDLPDNKVKVFAGWLIDQCNLKGYEFKTLKIYDKNALVITNPEKITDYRILNAFKSFIIEKVFEKFGIKLSVEPEII